MEAITNFEIHCGSDIEQAIRQIDKTFYVANHKKFSDTHVFDEDKSVKWNREEVERRNQAIHDEWKATMEAKGESYQHLHEEIYRYIMEEAVFGRRFTYNEAKAIWQQTCNHHDQYPWDWVDEMADTMHEFIIARECKDNNG